MKKREAKKRQFLPTLADLIDALTISQIKEIKFQNRRAVYSREIKRICHDIDIIVEEKNVIFDSKFMRIVAYLAQLNLYIWENKEKMQKANAETYVKLLKHAHQLNGVRNRLKNKILQEIGNQDSGKKRTNVETDDLKGWDIDID